MDEKRQAIAAAMLGLNMAGIEVKVCAMFVPGGEPYIYLALLNVKIEDLTPAMESDVHA